MVNLDKYKEIIIWGADFSPNEVDASVTSSGNAVEKLYNLLQSNGYTEKIIFLLIVTKHFGVKQDMVKKLTIQRQ